MLTSGVSSAPASFRQRWSVRHWCRNQTAGTDSTWITSCHHLMSTTTLWRLSGASVIVSDFILSHVKTASHKQYQGCGCVKLLCQSSVSLSLILYSLWAFLPACRFVADALASQQTVWYRSDQLDDTTSLFSGGWKSAGPKSRPLMVWGWLLSFDVLENQVLRGYHQGRTPQGSSNLSSVLLSLDGFCCNSEGHSVRLPCSWQQPAGACLEQLWSNRLTNDTVINTLITLPRFWSLCPSVGSSKGRVTNFII